MKKPAVRAMVGLDHGDWHMEDVSPKPPIQPRYMGDGVYAEFDGYQIWLYTQDGDRIALEPAVYMAVRAYGAKIWGLKP